MRFGMFQKILFFCMALLALAVASGCVLSEKKIFEEKETSLLGGLFVPLPNIAGNYISEKEGDSHTIKKVEGYENLFLFPMISGPQGGGGKEVEFTKTVVVPLTMPGAMILQMEIDNKGTKGYALFPAWLNNAEWRLYSALDNDGWDKKKWEAAMEKHGVILENGQVTDATPEAMTALFEEMFAAGAMGKGIVWRKVN